MTSAADPVQGESVRRFDVALQRSHLLVYCAAALTGLIGGVWLHVFPVRVVLATIDLAAGFAAILVFMALFKRGVDRRVLNPLWMFVDIMAVNVGVYATDGINSPWFIWYLPVAAAAAFASGKRAAHAVSIFSAVSYMSVLLIMGQASLINDTFLLGFTRMLFLFGAAYFFLDGIGNLQEKRLRIRLLEAEESRKVEELTRLANDLAHANRRIQEADRLKSQFLATMSHELRTPMNSIIGFSEILTERLEGRIEEKHYGFLKHILSSGQHLLGIINDVLDLTKIEAGKMEIYPEFFPIAPVVDSVCNVMRGMSKTVPNFAIDIPEDLPQIETDLAKFKQILFNLLSNAVKFSPPQSPITISARFIGQNADDGAITVSVADEGIGIDPQHHEMIFEEFRQVDASVRREHGGTGLGLALVKKFVELQGGNVRVDSAPKRGSVFSFTLPVKSRAAVVSRAAEVPVLTQQEMQETDRVLVVEDDTNAYDLIASALGSAGYLSIRARHGEEALKLARDASPAAVTLDLVLPGIDGWEVLKRLKSDNDTCDIPVVIISVVDNRDLGVALGADDYFVKPVDRERLLQRIRDCTSRRPRPCLLLIDDDEAVHTLLDAELGHQGFAFINAFNGEDGLRAARESSPDVIILDLMMPGMSGFEVADSLKDDPTTANIPILVLTSKDLTADDRRELQNKVSSFVTKGKSARDQLLREIKRLQQRRLAANA